MGQFDKTGMNSAAFSRRVVVATAAVGGMYLLIPKRVFAEEISSAEQGQVMCSAYPDLTESEFDSLLRERAEAETAKIIDQALAGPEAAVRANGRPTYDTVYGATTYKSSGWHDIAGQPPGGVQIAGEGYIFVSPSGGGSITVSVALPGGLGSVGVSIPKAKRSLGVTAYSIKISGSSFYKVTANVTHKVQPYVVYETKYGVRRVYAKMATSLLYSMALNKRKVG